MSPSSGQNTLRRLVSRTARSPARISTVSVSVGKASDGGPNRGRATALREVVGPAPSEADDGGRRRRGRGTGAARGRAQLRAAAAAARRGREGDGVPRRVVGAAFPRDRGAGGGVAGSAPAACWSWRGLAPAARPISVIVRPDTTDRGFVTVRSSCARVLVPVLDEEPLPAAARPDQDPRALKLLPEQHELEVALLELAIGVRLVPEPVPGDRRPDALVPDHHGPAAVLALGDDALELVVVHRVGLGLHREPLHGGVGRRALRDRPREHHPAVLQPEVVVERGRAVLLDDELEGPPRLPRPRGPLGLGCDVEVALPVVLGEPAVRAHVRELGGGRGPAARLLSFPGSRRVAAGGLLHGRFEHAAGRRRATDWPPPPRLRPPAPRRAGRPPRGPGPRKTGGCSSEPRRTPRLPPLAR